MTTDALRPVAANTTQLVEAVRAAMSGDTLISPSVTVRHLRDLTAARPRSTAQPVGIAAWVWSNGGPRAV